MPVSQLVALRNMKDGVVVLTPHFSEPNNFLEFQAAGDPGGGDVQYVSEELATSPASVKAIQHGILALETDTMSPDVRNAFEQQMTVARQQREQAESTIAQTIDRPENRDLVGVSCVGPGERPGTPCGVSVPMKDTGEVPPLCGRHAHLAAEYTQVEDVRFSPDETKRHKTYKWFRTKIDERERERA